MIKTSTRQHLPWVLKFPHFNAHYLLLSPGLKTDVAGRHTAQVIETSLQIALFNNHKLMHVRGGVLDLTFATESLSKRIRWSVGHASLPDWRDEAN